jgi:hypothetical protein
MSFPSKIVFNDLSGAGGTAGGKFSAGIDGGVYAGVDVIPDDAAEFAA